jgi:hypothetical protein
VPRPADTAQHRSADPHLGKGALAPSPRSSSTTGVTLILPRSVGPVAAARTDQRMDVGCLPVRPHHVAGVDWIDKELGVRHVDDAFLVAGTLERDLHPGALIFGGSYLAAHGVRRVDRLLLRQWMRSRRTETWRVEPVGGRRCKLNSPVRWQIEHDHSIRHGADPAPEHVLAAYEVGDIGGQRLGVYVVGGRAAFCTASIFCHPGAGVKRAPGRVAPPQGVWSGGNHLFLDPDAGRDRPLVFNRDCRRVL